MNIRMISLVAASVLGAAVAQSALAEEPQAMENKLVRSNEAAIQSYKADHGKNEQFYSVHADQQRNDS